MADPIYMEKHVRFGDNTLHVANCAQYQHLLDLNDALTIYRKITLQGHLRAL